MRRFIFHFCDKDTFMTEDSRLESARHWRITNIPMTYAAPMASGMAVNQPIVVDVETYTPSPASITLEPYWTDEQVARFADARVREALEEACKICMEMGAFGVASAIRERFPELQPKP
jgi:hypothetical protein